MQDTLILSSSINKQLDSKMTSVSNFQPKDKTGTANTENTKPKTDNLEKVVKKKEKGKEKAVSHVPMMFFAADSKKVTPKSKLSDALVDDGSALVGGTNEYKTTDDDSGDEDGKFIVNNPTNLIDIKSKSKLKEGANKGGRPKNSLLNDLLQKCYQKSEPEKHLFRCVGGCRMTYANRNLNRTICHATGCHHLPASIRIRAKAYAASKAPSRNLSVDDPESTKVHVDDRDTKESGEEEVGGVIAVKKRKLNDGCASSSKTSQLYEHAKRLGRKERHDKLHLAVVKLFCCSGIPSFIAEQKVWKDLLNLADPTYVPTPRATLEEVQIVGEAESIQQIQIAYLKTQNNITVSCNGPMEERHREERSSGQFICQCKRERCTSWMSERQQQILTRLSGSRITSSRHGLVSEFPNIDAD
jgi:hypothetical protein